jgi:hypothetical protein
MKKLITAVICTSLLAITACSVQQSEDKITLSPFEFELPSEWTIVEVSDSTAKVAIPDYEENQLTLMMDLKELDGSALPTEQEEVTTTEEGIQIYFIPTGGGYYYKYLAYDEVPYSVGFTLESTEEAPEELDGIWVPNNDFEGTRADIDTFIETVKLVK